MKYNVIKALSFFAGLYIIIVICSNVIGGNNGEDYVFDRSSVRVKLNEINKEPERSLQVIFIGDSICYSSFSPEILWNEYGITSYVCASSAQRLCDGYVIAKECYEKQDPKVIVLETTCLYRNIDIEKENNDFVLNIFNQKFPLIQRHSDWKEYADRAVRVKTSQERKSIKGFVPRKNTNPYSGGEYMNFTDGIEKIPEDVEKYLDRLKRLCDEKGSLLFLVSSPSPLNWSFERHNAVEQWANDNKVEYLDLNLEGSLGIDWQCDTKDGGDHLNINGASKTSTYIGKHLVESYYTEDYRKNEKYMNWMPIQQ